MEYMAYIKHNLMTHLNCSQSKLSQQFSRLCASFSLILPPLEIIYADFMGQTENITTIRGQGAAFLKGLPYNTIKPRLAIVPTTSNR